MTKDPSDFLKCPECHRSTTVEMRMHIDGDVSLDCTACEAHASAFPLNQNVRVYK
jgi:hypothetical protein